MKIKQKNIKHECNICLQPITHNFATLNCNCKVNYHKECCRQLVARKSIMSKL